MYLMVADEADQDGAKEFLVFAGVFYPTENLMHLHLGVAALRKKHGFNDEDDLKFSTGSKPDQVTREQHSQLKNDILQLAAKNGCKVCCYVVPHSIAKGQSAENKMKYGTNTLLGKFDQFLTENGNVPGVAFFDRSTDFSQDAYFKDIFQNGVPMRSGKKRRFLGRVITVESTSLGHSHLNSITDVVVGSFRFVANEPDKDIVGKKLLRLLAKLLWGKKNSKGVLNVRERGLCIRPKEIKAIKLQADVEAFVARLNSYLA